MTSFKSQSEMMGRLLDATGFPPLPADRTAKERWLDETVILRRAAAMAVTSAVLACGAADASKLQAMKIAAELQVREELLREELGLNQAPASHEENWEHG